jgi:hypothetical protein
MASGPLPSAPARRGCAGKPAAMVFQNGGGYWRTTIWRATSEPEFRSFYSVRRGLPTLNIRNLLALFKNFIDDACDRYSGVDHGTDLSSGCLLSSRAIEQSAPVRWLVRPLIYGSRGEPPGQCVQFEFEDKNPVEQMDEVTDVQKFRRLRSCIAEHRAMVGMAVYGGWGVRHTISRKADTC